MSRMKATIRRLEPLTISAYAQLIVVILGVAVALWTALAPTNQSATVAIIAAFVVSAYLLVVSRKNWLLAIVFVFLTYCIYSILCAQYLDLVGDSPYNAFSGTPIAWRGALVMLVFMLCLAIVIPPDMPRFPTVPLCSPSPNWFVVAVCAAVVIFAGLTGLDEVEGVERLKISSSLYEYSIILLIIGIYYTAFRKSGVVLMAAVLLFRTYLDFTSGNRVTSLEMVVAFFLMCVAWKARWRVLVPLGVTLFVILMGVGSLRGESFSLDLVLDRLGRVFEKRGLAWDGAFSAYHTSLSILATEAHYSLAERISALPSYLLSISVIPFDLGGLSNPTSVALTHYWHLGGTYLPFAFHFYLGLPGVIAGSLLLGLLLRRIAVAGGYFNSLSDVKKLTIVWIGAAMFRWTQYEATSLVRGAALMALATLSVTWLLQILRKTGYCSADDRVALANKDQIDGSSSSSFPVKTAAIVTYHNSYSYGACLQAYATFLLFQRAGFNAYFVDYHNSHEDDSLGKKAIDLLPRLGFSDFVVLGLKNLLGYRRYALASFSSFHKELPKTKTRSRSTADFDDLCSDLLVVGSDQMWNPDISGGLDPAFFLDFGKPRRRISLATSMGSHTFREPGERDELCHYLSRLNAISVREKHAQKQIMEITGREAFLCLDPTLLIDADTWRGFAQKPECLHGDENYLLVFTVDNHPERASRLWHDVARELGVAVYRIAGNIVPVSGVDRTLRGVTPQEFVWLIDHAAYVCTDSFHGTAFSINLETPFAVFSNKRGNNVRMIELLEMCGLSNRFDNLSSDCHPLPKEEFTDARQRILSKREECLAWLDRVSDLSNPVSLSRNS